MDSQTHVEFAEKIMGFLGAPPALAVCSLFPQIDRKPPTLHRLHAHTIFKARAFVSLGLDLIFGHGEGEFQGLEFERGRFLEEAPRFRKYSESLGPDLRGPISAGAAGASLAAYVSHLYLDTFNQPVQPFAPHSVACAGQWDLWKTLGDFRKRLYTTDAIERLRAEVMTLGLWLEAPQASAGVWVEAMLIRLERLSRGESVGDGVGKGLEACALSPAGSRAAGAVVGFLATFERTLCDLHQKHLEGDPAPATGDDPSLALSKIR